MTDSTTRESPWDDPRWRVAGDSSWQAGLRWQQCWWRAERLGRPAGPFSKDEPARLVGSTLGLDAPPDANFLTREAAAAAELRLASSGGGLVKEDRLRRFLLSSQPMCFNLFGHFQDPSQRDALAGWVRRHDGQADHVTRVEVEWAPPPADHFRGGSAFDAFVEYRRHDGDLGFLAVECKYHEDLARSDVPDVRTVYRSFTESHGLWRTDAVSQLDRRGLRQFWLNTLLAQSLLRTGAYAAGKSIIVACAADRSARDACATVRAELTDPSTLVWDPWEAVAASIEGHDEWRDLFITRYLDFRPVAHLLADDDPRRMGDVDTTTAAAIATRVLGDGSVLEQLQSAGVESSLIWSRLGIIIDELKRLRIDAGVVLDAEHGEATP